MSSRSAFRAVVFLVLLASCSLPRPTVGLAIAGTTVPASREGSSCQTGGCSGVCGDTFPPTAPLTTVRAASPIRLDFSGGAEINHIHGDIWQGETMSGQPLETFDLGVGQRSYTSQRMSEGKYYLLVSLRWSRVTDSGDTSFAFSVATAPP